MKKLRIDLISDLAHKHREFDEITVIRPLVNAFLGQIKAYLMEGHSIHLSRFGNFVTSTHKGKRIVSNLDGSVAVIPPRRMVKFKTGDYFRDELNRVP